MADETPKKTEINNKLRDLLKQLTTDQIRFVTARQFAKSDREAAEIIKISPHTMYHWNNKEMVDEAIKLMALDGVIVASELIRRNLPKAATELGDELNHKDVNIRHKAAVVLLTAGGVNAPVKHDVTVETFIKKIAVDADQL